MLVDCLSQWNASAYTHHHTHTHTCGLRVLNNHGSETIDRYACLGLVRMQRGNRSSRNSKNIRNRIQCALSSETQYRRYRISLYFYFWSRHKHLPLLFVDGVSWIFCFFFHFLTSHIRSFVRFASIYSSSPHLFGIGRRHTNYPFLFLLSILSCAHSHRIREFCESVDKKGALYRWELVLGCRVRRARISIRVIWYARMCVAKFLFLLRSNGVSVRA